MLSLTIIILLFVAYASLQGWLLAVAARRAGTSRGRLRVGIGIVVAVWVASIPLETIARLMPDEPTRRTTVMSLALVVAQIAITFAVIRRGFRLSAKRALIPFGAYVATFGMLFCVAYFVVKPYVAEAFVMPAAESMKPTLLHRDRIVANRFIAPRRWDMTAYWVEDLRDPDASQVYCKRIVGLPGERLRFSGGTIYVNDQPAVGIPPVIAGRCHASPYGPHSSYRSLYRDDETITLGPDEFFMLGDNLNVSADSRINGPARRSSLIGPIDLIYWPPSRARIVR